MSETKKCYYIIRHFSDLCIPIINGIDFYASIMKEPSQNIDNLELWERYLSGDQNALGKLYQQLFHKLFLFCYRSIQNKEEAKDIVQDAFRKLIEQKSTEIYDLEGWLKNGIRFIVRTRYRDDKNHREHLDRYKSTLPSQTESHSNIDAENLKQQIQTTLTPTNAKVIHLASQGFKNQEIAQELGITEKQVRNRKSESKKKLKNIIGGVKS